MTEELQKTLNEMLQQFGCKAEELWPMMAEKVVADWWLDLIQLGVLFAITATCLFCFRWSLKMLSKSEGADDEDLYGYLMIILGGVSVLATCGCIGSLMSIVGDFSNVLYPETAVLEQLMGR